jgi:3-(3-hydroxy-phenyl)propionate hydroxylase
MPGGGPTGRILAGELALAGVNVAIVERRATQDLLGSRAGGLHTRTIDVLDPRGIADRFLLQGQVAQVAGFAWIPLDISDFPTRHNYGLGLWQKHIERILADWVDEFGVPIYRGPEVTPFRAGRHRRRRRALRRRRWPVAAGGLSRRVRRRTQSDPESSWHRVPGWDATTSNLIAEVEMAEEPE